MNEAPETWPLFKGACREPTYWGIPRTPFVLAGMGIFMLGYISLWLWLLIFGIFPAMRYISIGDDRVFSIWWLWFLTVGLNRNKKFWGAASYSPNNYRDRFLK